MSESDLLFDTWAWWEYLHGTPTGHSLRKRFVEGGRFRLHTSVITLGEVSARLDAEGRADLAASTCGSIRRMSHMWDVTADIAQDAGIVRSRLRRSAQDASLADGIVYVTAQRAGARIVSADPAFRGIPGLISG